MNLYARKTLAALAAFFTFAIVLLGAAPAQAAQNWTGITHSPNSLKSYLTVRMYDGYSDFYDTSVLRGNLISGGTNNGWWPRYFYVPSGFCYRGSAYVDNVYQYTLNGGSGWKSTPMNTRFQVAIVSC